MEQLDTPKGLDPVKPRRKRAEERPAPKAPLILVVDDFPAAREMYVRFLSASGFRVEEAAGGPEAIEKALALHPELVVMDLAMPVMDGWEATRRLKADAQTTDCLIVAVSGAGYAGGAQKARDAGCDGFIEKPCLPETLLGAVRGLLARKRGL